MSSDQARQVISGVLQPGEQLIWFGQPKGFAIASRPALGLAFALVWAVFGFIAVRHSVNHNAFFPNMPPGNIYTDGIVLFIAAIVIVSCARALMKLFYAWRTTYGITNRRVIIAVAGTNKVESFTGSALSRIERKGSAEFGTLLFDYGPQGDSRLFRNGFYGIRDPARVEALIYQHVLQTPEKPSTR
jgi:hypothetical protein